MFRDNTEQHRFEWLEQGQVTFATYRDQGGVRTIPHVEAPMALRGTGSAGRLMEALTNHARERGIKLYPICSYAVAWYRRHKEAQDVLA